MQYKDYSNARATPYGRLPYIYTTKPSAILCFQFYILIASQLHQGRFIRAPDLSSMSWFQGNLRCKAHKGDRMSLSRHPLWMAAMRAPESTPWHPSACCRGHSWFHQCFSTPRSCFVTKECIKWFHSLHFWSPRNTVVRDSGIKPNLNTKCTNYLLFNSGHAKLHPALCPPRCCISFHSQQGWITPQLCTFFQMSLQAKKHCCCFINAESHTAQSQLDPYLVTK